MRQYLLIPFLMLGALVLRAEDNDDKSVVGSTDGTLVMNLHGSFRLRPSGGLLFGSPESSLFDATMNLREALQAPEKRLALDLTNDFSPGFAAAEELAAVLRARPANKKVSCLVDGISDAALVMIAACDEVVIAEAGLVSVKGLAGGMDYYADALAKIGVRFHAVTSGPAKTAPEPLTRSSPSDTAKAELAREVSSLDQALLEMSVRGNCDVDALRIIRSRAPQTAAIAKETKLADLVAEPGAWLKQLPPPVRYFKAKDKSHDFDSLPGIMAAITELFNGPPEVKHPQAVAVVELEGDILDGDGGVPGMGITGHDTAKLFDRLSDDTRIVAVVVRVNSPGGSAGASDRIHFAIRRCTARKPVVALFDGVAASGGYYLGCAAQEILVHRGTITGSIGVFSLIPDLAETKRLLGINHYQFTTASRADLFNLNDFTPEKESALRQVIESVDDRFQSLVSERRKLTRAVVKGLAGGQIFTGDEAIQRGLADRLGDLPSAVARARELAHQPNPLPLERFPKASGLAARLGLDNTFAGTIATQAGLPQDLVRWAQLAQSGKPLIMCWAAVPTVR